jgi:hypothetical protein
MVHVRSYLSVILVYIQDMEWYGVSIQFFPTSNHNLTVSPDC